MKENLETIKGLLILIVLQLTAIAFMIAFK